jgi:hypothetical protein
VEKLHPGVMKYLLLTVILIVGLLLVTPSSAQDNPYYRVDSMMRLYNWKIKTVDEVYRLTHYIRTNFDADSLRARACFIWITHNIAYDIKAANSDNPLAGSIDYALKNKRAVCAGFASLYKYLCNLFDIECEVVEGYARTGERDVYIGERNLRSNHAWNTIKINGNWRLVDPTWAAGYSSEENGLSKKFFKSFNETYYFIDPKKLILNHFPDKFRYQYLTIPVKADEFKKKPLVFDTFLDDSITHVFPEGIPLKAKKGDTLTFRFRSSSVFQHTMLYASSPGKDKATYRGWAELKSDGWYEFKYPVSISGYYPLYIGYDHITRVDYLYAYRLEIK